MYKLPICIEVASLHYVVKISYLDKTSTGFFVSIRGASVMLTAKHCIPGITDGDCIGIKVGLDWRYINIYKVFLDPDGRDAAAVIFTEKVAEGGLTKWGMAHIILSQPAIYCGFPLELKSAMEIFSVGVRCL